MEPQMRHFIIFLFYFVTHPLTSQAFQTYGSLDSSGLASIETGYTISKVQMATGDAGNYIVASSYEGTLLGISYDGQQLWGNPLSGFLNQAITCADLDGDGVDEILAANADGTLYCLTSGGQLLWKFKLNDAPMNAVAVIHRDGKPYVACGSYDTNIYYLSAEGRLLLALPSSYTIEHPYLPYPKPVPPDNRHTANFIRTVKRADGSEIMAVHGVIHSMSRLARGAVYLFEPLATEPYKIIELEEGRPMGECRVGDIDGDGTEEVLLGGNGMRDAADLIRVDIESGEQEIFHVSDLGDQVEGFGYRVLQPAVLASEGQDNTYFLLFGTRILLVPKSMDPEATDVLVNKYSYNDFFLDGATGRIVLASAQSGGSCIHIVDTKNRKWKNAYSTLQPPGKIESILKNTKEIRKNLANFKKPSRERDPLPVWLMTERTSGPVAKLVEDLKRNYDSPIFLGGANIRGKEKWDRSAMTNDRYRERRDARMTYNLSRKEIVDSISANYKDHPGLAFWGGHGNDPYMYHLETNKAILDSAQGKKTVLIFPELEDHSHYFAEVMEDYFYPLAEHCRTTNGQIFVRTKHCFWQSNIYLPMWSRLTSGEFSDVFIPSMEETTDKSMELSLASRLGVWTSGAVDSWGSRCARDNTSYDRLRQFSHQMLPNHFLRMMVFHISNGAQYINNFPVDQEYMSLLWELIAKGALYVPERSEILSFSPVHLSMLEPDEHFMDESSNTKWTTFFDQDWTENNPFVFSRLNGSWPGAPVTEWDFSRYAAGVKERRLNFLAPYRNGLVLITPPQDGRHAQKDPPRGKLEDNLHPYYKSILKEYYTDGRYYYSKDGEKQYSADEYYKIIEKDIQESASKLPLTVSGDVAWVVAQTSPKHLRLTLIDSGYINPDERVASVRFHTVHPIQITDILSKETFSTSDDKATIQIPCGGFRFIDIELSEPL